MKQITLCLLIVSLMLTGCAAGQVSGKAAQVQTTAATEPTRDPVLGMLAAYEHTLEVFYNDRRSPAGDDLEVDEGIFGRIEENSFAIADVDGDGSEELVIVFGTAPTAGMCAWICGYDAETDSVYQKLAIFPSQVFYTGGLLEAEWSHNQGLAGAALWPYTLMRYNPDSRTYEVIAQVDAWDSSLQVNDSQGNPFPKELDTDNAGAVYLISTPGQDGQWATDTVSRSVYEAWRTGIFGENKPIEVEYLKTTLDNIRAVSPD